MEAKKNLFLFQDGDVSAIYANVKDLVRDVNYRPNTPVKEVFQGMFNGIRNIILRRINYE